MIGFVRGQVLETTSEAVVVDVGGVGYELHASVNTLDSCLPGDEVRLYVHTHVREDAITLYGFATRLEKQLFLSLLKVNGVGPKLAIKALGAGPLSNLVDMIEAGDVKGLAGLPKVGKKTAEQIVLTLRGKLLAEELESAGTVREGPAGASARSGARKPLKSEIISALVNLGFRAADVEKVVAELPAELGFEEGVRKGLAALTGPA